MSAEMESTSAQAGPSSETVGSQVAPTAQLSLPPSIDTDALPTFASISHLLSPPILLALSNLRFSHPTPVQAQVLPLALSGHDIVARARTGSGKTLAYGLPIVQKIFKTKEAVGKTSSDYQRIRALVLVPTRELAEQVTNHLGRICQSSNEDIRVVNLAREASSSVHKLLLADRPDVVVATPSRALSFIQSKALPLDLLESLVLDEADLLLSYGHDTAVRALFSGNHLPKNYQSYLMSATMSQDVEELRSLLAAGGRKAQVLNVQDPNHHSHLTQYYVYTSEDSKFLLLYVLLKLRLVRGKVLIFVNDVDRGYKLRLFLETFGVRSCVLNAEMPSNSRYHVVQEFNKGVYEVIIATDESSHGMDRERDQVLMRDDPKEEEDEDEEDEETDEKEVEEEEDEDEEGSKDKDDADAGDEEDKTGSKRKREVDEKKSRKKSSTKDKKGSANASEYGVSRGIDFVAVSCVINFDLPTSLSSYIHRIGRTARAHQTGIALSFVVPADKVGQTNMKGTLSPTSYRDEIVWKKVIRHMTRGSSRAHKIAVSQGNVTNSQPGAADVRPWSVNWTQVFSFQYRIEDSLRSTTRGKIREARIKELKSEILRSQRLKNHFEDNPKDFDYLRHDKSLDNSVNNRSAHLKHIPEYLMPDRRGLKAPKAPKRVEEGGEEGKNSRISYDEQGRSLGYVGLRKQQRGGGSNGRGRGRGRGGFRGGRGGSGGKKKNPLRTG
ncbi:unnamed protein product [Sympodiomycopsis kandeliae]